MKALSWRACVALALLLGVAACGGGDPARAPEPLARAAALGSDGHPMLGQSPGFRLPPIGDPLGPVAVTGQQRGRVLLRGAAAAPAGLVVDLLDASDSSAPRVLASTTTASDGGFSIAAITVLPPADTWLRVTLGNGATLRAFAAGWTELSPGTEAVVREIVRLRRAGALSTRPLLVGELADAQASVTMAWRGHAVDEPVLGAAAAMVKYLEILTPWNRLLGRFDSAEPAQGSGDIAGMMPVAPTDWPSTLRSDGSTTQTIFSSTCSGGASEPLRRGCAISTPDDPDLTDRYDVTMRGISLRTPVGPNDPVALVLYQVGDLPLLEFPHAVGTRVLIDAPRFSMPYYPTLRAAVRITRRTFATAPVKALGRSVPAVQVVLDYELAVLDTSTGQLFDVLARERRWFSPQGGRVRSSLTGLVRVGDTVAETNVNWVADAVDGRFFEASDEPHAGVLRVEHIGLQHRHAVYSSARDRIYVATDAGGGRVLELAPDTLATLRSFPAGGVPRRLAVSADGRLLYVGLDGGQVVERRLADFVERKRFTLPTDPYGDAYDRVYDLAVDPYDASRILVLAGRSALFGNAGAVLVYRDGQLVLRDAPRYNASDYGWGYYSPMVLAWTGVPDEFLAAFMGIPASLYRFRATETATTELASLQRVDQVGIHDVDGRIVTRFGKVLESSSLKTLRRLRLGSIPLGACNRLTPRTVLCMTNPLGYDSRLILLNFANSSYLGAYRPSATAVNNGCTGVSEPDGTRIDIRQRVTPLGGGRSLVSTIPGDEQGEMCSLQLWTLQGADL